MRFEYAGRYMSTPTTVVQIFDNYIFYKAGIRCALVLGRYEHHKRVIDFVCFQVNIKFWDEMCSAIAQPCSPTMPQQLDFWSIVLS